MAPMRRDAWAAEVAIDEPICLSIPMWSVGRIVGSIQTDETAASLVPISEMITWLRQRSFGQWCFVRRERVAGRVALEYRGFEFEQVADAREFAAAWAEKIIQLRLDSIERQIGEFGFSAACETHADGQAHGWEKRKSRSRLDDVVVLVIDVWPLRRRQRALERLCLRPVSNQVRELVEADMTIPEADARM